MTGRPSFPEMRLEVIGAVRALSDPEYQERQWGHYEEGVNFYDDLKLNVHILYDDTMVLPDPEGAVSTILYAEEVPALSAIDRALGPLLDQLGDQPDSDYLAHPGWPAVVRAAAAALTEMRRADGEE